MNVLSRIIGAIVATVLAWIGARLGIEFSPEDHASVTMWATGALVVLYGMIHPVVRSWLVRITGKGARESTGAGEVKP